MAEHGSLKGKVFKAKLLSPERLRGLGALALSYTAYMKLLPLTLMMGSTVPMMGLVASTVYGMSCWSQTKYISTIESG